MKKIRLEIQDTPKKTNKQLSRNLSEFGIENLYIQNAYDLSFEQDDVSQKVIEEIFVDDVIQKIIYHSEESLSKKTSYLIEVSYKEGVTDNPANSAMDAFLLFQKKVKISSIKQYFFSFDGPKCTDDHKKTLLNIANEYLHNNLIQEIVIYNQSDISDRFNHKKLSSKQSLHDFKIYQEILLNDPKDSLTEDEYLLKLSDERLLALNLEEMKYIKSYYQSSEIIAKRKKLGLSSNPTDVELEVIAQTWSEHCKHKIFAAKIDYKEEAHTLLKSKRLGNISINSLYRQYIKDTTKEINSPWCKSVFTDNAGIVDFDKNLNLCIKVETHNSPSALDPYGGSITGILGVNRDILGCGMGAKPIANTDVFCLAPNEWPTLENKPLMPDGPKSPRRMLPGVHSGVEDGGNKSGIPTVNGAIYFDADYAGKPLVYVGTVGVMPKVLPSGKVTHEKYGRPGDLIVMAGGHIGKDGIHGATFSSLDLDESSPTSAVQIGDPLTQKRLLDFIQKARDLELFTSITDNGAGGLSSSVGEMAHDIGGARLDLALCPLKYPGLNAFEVMISESQERMTFAVAPENKDKFLKLAVSFGVSAHVIGEFNDSGSLDVFWNKQRVAHFDHKFLHESLPQMKLEAVWDEKYCMHRNNWHESKKVSLNNETASLSTIFKTVLNSKNVRSKESLIRNYDHEVGGATHIKPFMGDNSSPSDAGAIWLAPHGGEKDNAVAVACGMNPKLSLYDPYLMAKWAVDETVRNLISVGVDPDYIALLDNFCWPDPVYSSKNPEGKFRLAQLVRSCIGLQEACNIFNTPLVSGKDSMKNNFRGKSYSGDKLDISILPTLLVTGIGKLNTNLSTSNHFQKAGDLIYLLGERGTGLLLSELENVYSLENSYAENVPEFNLESNNKLYRKVYQAINNHLLNSIHDISDGGLICALSESLFANNVGARIMIDSNLREAQLDFLFNETPGRFVISISKSNLDDFQTLFGSQAHYLGEVTDDHILHLSDMNSPLEEISVRELELSWKESLV